MGFCASCGSGLQPGTRFCAGCGAPAPAPAPQPIPQQMRMARGMGHAGAGPTGRMPTAVPLKPTQALQLPAALNRCYLGLGWQSRPGARELDLDASAALFSGGQCVNLVSFENLRDTAAPPSTVVHTGDIMAGGGSMKSSPSASRDLERIYIDLFKLNQRVDTVVLLVNCFTDGATFAELQRATCRIVNADSEQELGRFELGGRLNGNGMIFGQLSRVAPGARHWQYVALGMARPGRTAADLVATVAAGARQTGSPSKHKANQVVPTADTVAKSPTASRVSPGLVAATAAGTAAGAAIFTAVALDTGMLGGEGGGIIAGAMADLSDISMPEMPFDVDLAPVGEAMGDLGEMAGDAVDASGRGCLDARALSIWPMAHADAVCCTWVCAAVSFLRDDLPITADRALACGACAAVGDLAGSLQDGFDNMGGMEGVGDSLGKFAQSAGEGMGDLAHNAGAWMGDAGEGIGENLGDFAEGSVPFPFSCSVFARASCTCARANPPKYQIMRIVSAAFPRVS